MKDKHDTAHVLNVFVLGLSEIGRNISAQFFYCKRKAGPVYVYSAESSKIRQNGFVITRNRVDTKRLSNN